MKPTLNKREGESNSPDGFSGGVARVAGVSRSGNDHVLHPRKIRRSQTYDGRQMTSQAIDEYQDNAPKYILPCFLEKDIDRIHRITPETVRVTFMTISNPSFLLQLSLVLQGQFNEKIDEFHLIDCRYPFEYQGGHIVSAQNINTIAEIQSKFFTVPPPAGKRIVIVFHCEYSVQRAPQM